MADDYPTMTVSVSACQTEEATRLAVYAQVCECVCQCAVHAVDS